MTTNQTTNTIEQLASKLEELESEMALDTNEAIHQFEEHCQELKKASQGFLEQAHGLNDTLGIEWHALKQQLDDLELQLTLARMETEDAFREQKEGILNSLTAMDTTMQRIESAEDHEGILRYKDFVAKIRKLEGKMENLHIHFKLGKHYTGEALVREREKTKKLAKEFSQELRELGETSKDELPVIGRKIQKASAFVWEALAAGMFGYDLTDAERQERKETDGNVPD
ncbi:MAG: hypothetical protein ACSHYB_01680 [Roseibacillus sp.]